MFNNFENVDIFLQRKIMWTYQCVYLILHILQ